MLSLSAYLFTQLKLSLSLSLPGSLSIYLSIFLPMIAFHEEMVRTHIEYCSQYFGVCACTVTGKVHQLERVALKDASSPAQPPAYQPATVCPLKMFFLTIQRRIPFLRPIQGDHYILLFSLKCVFFLTLWCQICCWSIRPMTVQQHKERHWCTQEVHIWTKSLKSLENTIFNEHPVIIQIPHKARDIHCWAQRL